MLKVYIDFSCKILTFTLFFHLPLLAKEKPDMFYDQNSGLQLPLPSNMIIGDNNSALITHYKSDSLIKDSRKVVSFEIDKSDIYHYYIRGDVLISKGDVSEETCYSSYPTCMNYERHVNSTGKVLPDKILINGYHFIYLHASEGAAGTAYDTYIYRGMIDDKCVFFDIYSRQVNPYNYLDTTGDVSSVQNAYHSFNNDIETVNNIIRNTKFNINK
ncbi:hypothetical protein wNo_00570 [Wolbachia endosymbiont of Drosophila simulans wNo]|uniref:hypothetical protein n=2 Tax=Wolbachia TaxID=953 RepID=UPI0002D25181|nr:hypothetical protein [Wolbachia endosymbiont of Drosophila simulans]AGJ98517.1 hypothetical protein wNo_00570 [Wolbachia endosymbiont of Drosophila simulans wNo]QWE33016.1 Uncharacterized protein WwMa_00590 [Wolbachia endosymbiont of Drosophila simulans]